VRQPGSGFQVEKSYAKLVDLMNGGGFFVNFLSFAVLHAVACLECGAVTRYLDDAAVAKLRAQTAKPSKAKAVTDEL
jgi:hypothetical protein